MASKQFPVRFQLFFLWFGPDPGKAAIRWKNAKALAPAYPSEPSDALKCPETCKVPRHLARQSLNNRDWATQLRSRRIKVVRDNNLTSCAHCAPHRGGCGVAETNLVKSQINVPLLKLSTNKKILRMVIQAHHLRCPARKATLCGSGNIHK